MFLDIFFFISLSVREGFFMGIIKDVSAET
jgi:hypothetical protein